MKDKVEKSLLEVLNRYEKEEYEKKRFFPAPLENDSKKNTRAVERLIQTQIISNYFKARSQRFASNFTNPISKQNFYEINVIKKSNFSQF